MVRCSFGALVILRSKRESRLLKTAKNCIIIYLQDSHSLCTGVTAQYFLHIARSQVHIARS